jgi:hypothetical protein
MAKGIFPNFKKNVSDFLNQEDGKITKQSALALGAFTFGAVLGSMKDVEASVGHTNSFSNIQIDGDWSSGISLTMQHTHHASHSTHSSHSSHGNP